MELNNLQADYYELPIAASTSLDGFFEAEAGTTTLQKRRVAIRSDLGLVGPDFGWMDRRSLGGQGSFQLVPSSVLLCLQADMAWRSKGFLNSLTQTITAHGLPMLMGSSTMIALTEMIVKAARAILTEQPRDPNQSVSRAVNHAIRAVTLGTPPLRAFARDYSRLMSEVTKELVQVDRYTGNVVRIEDSQALIEIHTPECRELRWIPTSALETFGLDETDAPFVLIEQRWSPDRRASYFQPAVVESTLTDKEAEQIEREVRAHETPARDAVVPVY